MTRVTGSGGVFFKSKDPDSLREWYRKHLGINVESWGVTLSNGAMPREVSTEPPTPDKQA